MKRRLGALIQEHCKDLVEPVASLVRLHFFRRRPFGKLTSTTQGLRGLDVIALQSEDQVQDAARTQGVQALALPLRKGLVPKRVEPPARAPWCSGSPTCMGKTWRKPMWRALRCLKDVTM